MFINRLRVGTRLILTAMAPIIALVILVVSAIHIFSKIEDGVNSIYNDRVVPLQDLKIIADDYAVLVIDAVNKANAGRTTAQEALANVNKAKIEIDAKWQAYLQTTLTKEEADLVKQAASLFTRANQAISSVESKLGAMSGNVKGQLDDFDGPLYDQIDPISDKLAELIALQLRVAGEERDRIQTMTSQLTTQYIVGTIIAASLVSILSFLVQRSIVRPLASLRNAMRKIEETSDITITIDIDSRDEFGQTANTFNRMMRRIDQLIGQVRQATLQVAAASEELATIAQQNTISTQNLQAETDQVATAVNEMSATIHQVAGNTTDAQQQAQHTDELASQGRQLSNDSQQEIQVLLGNVQATSDLLSQLEQESQSIGSVIDVINGIAEQTNLLALNAAIEAARAGEQGRGFAVVADEVRTLAQRTQQSTQEIRDAVVKLQQGSQNAVSAMQTARSRASECNTRMQTGLQSLSEIEQAVQRIRDMNIQIASAVEEQSAVANDISRNISSIHDITVQTNEASSNISSSSEHLSQLADEMNQQVSIFKTTS